MMVKFIRATALLSIVFLMSAPVGLAADEKKPGFHGWGDSQATMTVKDVVKEPPETIKEIPESKKPARKAETKRPKAVAKESRAAAPNAEIKEKVQRERKAFFKDSQKLRQEIYQKRLELRSELAKSDPSARRARSIQKDITKRRTELDRKRLEHFLKLKKIDPQMGSRKKSGRDGAGGCSNCPYRDRGDRGGDAMMGPGYERHQMWEDDGEWRQPSEKGKQKRYHKKYSSKSPRAAKELSQSDARSIVRDYLKSTRNPNIKLGKITDSGDAFQAEILTKDGSLVDKLLVDKESGAMRPAY